MSQAICPESNRQALPLPHRKVTQHLPVLPARPPPYFGCWFHLRPFSWPSVSKHPALPASVDYHHQPLSELFFLNLNPPRTLPKSTATVKRKNTYFHTFSNSLVILYFLEQGCPNFLPLPQHRRFRERHPPLYPLRHRLSDHLRPADYQSLQQNTRIS